MSNHVAICAMVSLLSAPALCRGAVLIDTSIGSGPPPAALGGYAVMGFPADTRPSDSWVTDAAPPPVVGGALLFSDPVNLYNVGPGIGDWNGWSHGYGGQVYFSPWTGAGGSSFAQLDLSLPAGTLAFYLYLEPEVSTAAWDFDVGGESVGGSSLATTLLIAGGGGASYIGLYSDDPMDALSSVSIRQTSEEFLGFGIGEFGVNAIPEPRTGALLAGLGVLGAAAIRRYRRLSGRTN